MGSLMYNPPPLPLPLQTPLLYSFPHRFFALEGACGLELLDALAARGRGLGECDSVGVGGWERVSGGGVLAVNV